MTYSRHPLYFVTICTADRRALLANPETHDAFVAFGQAGAAHGAFVGHYVLMPDHLHAFVSLAPGGVTLSGWAKSLKNCLSKLWRAGGMISPHWQKSFFDHLLRTTDSYREKWEYVLLNPVRAGLVAEANRWPYRGELHPLRF